MTIFYASATLAELSPLEVHRLYKLRVDVFVHEQQTPFAEIEDLDAAPGTTHLMALRTGESTELVGTIRLTPESDGSVRLGRLVVHSGQRGTEVAPALIERALRHIADRTPGADVVLSAQEPLIGYYEKFGFTPVGALTDDTGMAHQPMLLPAEKVGQLVKQPA